MAKVVVVTNPTGYMHINPLETRDFYQQMNVRVKDTSKHYKVQEMEQAEAEKFVADNSSFDPNFKSPKQVQAAIADKDAEIKRLRDELAKQNDPNSEVAK